MQAVNGRNAGPEIAVRGRGPRISPRCTGTRPIGIDLFAGAGGLSLGFEQAGFDIAAAVDVDPIHCAVHKFNFPTTTVIPGSVRSLSAKDIRALAGIESRVVDCVFGGAPCQGFSLIGHRALDDPRNQLVREFVRLVAELGARAFVFENVKGLAVGRQKAFLDELVQEFEGAGYSILTPVRVLNAAHFGTPQSRERLFLAGVLKGHRLPSYPAPTTSISGKPRDLFSPPFGPTCEDALEDLPNADDFAELLDSDQVIPRRFGQSSEYVRELRCQSNDPWHFGYQRDWDPSILTGSARTLHTAISRRRFAETRPGTVEPISRLFRLPALGVSNTLRAGSDGAHGAFTSPRPIHYKHPRCVTVREMARLHGFPDWFRFHVTKWHGARQIGNAVPPPLARAVAASVLGALEIEPIRPDTPLCLGDRELLSFDMTRAASHFGVHAPPCRRDRKSGATKRKQIDIERERLACHVAHV